MAEYFDPTSERFLDQTKVASASTHCQKEIAKHWFLQHFEDPAENTPYESAEGGYIYIWGGPCDARDELWSEFGSIIDEDVLNEAADELESDGITEWAKIPSAGDFDFPVERSNFYEGFSIAVGHLQDLLQVAVPKHLENSFYSLLFVNAITVFEAYLGDVFSSLVLRDPALLRKFVESDPDFKSEKLALSDIYVQLDGLQRKVRERLFVLPFHRLEKVQPMFKSVFGIEFPDGLRDLFKGIAIRHDLVHRNGKDKDGNIHAINAQIVQKLLSVVEHFIEQVDERIREMEKPPDAPPSS